MVEKSKKKIRLIDLDDPIVSVLLKVYRNNCPIRAMNP